ncbi:MAG: hypothetical protein COB56_08035 [Robiginitomaculum sp.]|nr:MAG: hypothetical protein COB56_08035 [Robiginitomaculum sp.]
MGWKFWKTSKNRIDNNDFGFASIDHKKANIDYLTQLLNILQKSFDDKQKTFSEIEAKARYFLTSFMVLFYAVLGYSLSQFIRLPQFGQIFIIAILVPFILTASYLLLALKPRERAEGFNLKGRTLDNVKKQIEAKNYDIKTDYVARCATLAQLCDTNLEVNKIKTSYIDNAIFTFMLSPILAFFTWFTLAISNHFGLIRICFNHFVGYLVIIATCAAITLIVIAIRHFITFRSKVDSVNM